MKIFNYVIVLIISFLSLISNYKKFSIGVDEVNIFNAIANSTYDFDVDYVKRISKLYPNLSSSAIPIKAVIGAHYITNDSIKKGIDELNKANLDNPYIGYPDMILARTYEILGIKDSFNYYTKRAYKKLPNNSASYLLLAKILVNEKKFDSLSYFFNDISDRLTDNNIWQIYLASMLSIEDKFKESKIDSMDVISNARKAKQISDDKTVTLLADYLIYGKAEVNKSIIKYETALDTFISDQEYAIKLMSEAVNQIGDNYQFYETLIEMYFKAENYEMVIATYSELINKNMTTLNGNTERILISYIYLDDIESGCNLAKLLNQYRYNLDDTVKFICELID